MAYSMNAQIVEMNGENEYEESDDDSEEYY